MAILEVGHMDVKHRHSIKQCVYEIISGILRQGTNQIIMHSYVYSENFFLVLHTI